MPVTVPVVDINLLWQARLKAAAITHQLFLVATPLEQRLTVLGGHLGGLSTPIAGLAIVNTFIQRVIHHGRTFFAGLALLAHAIFTLKGP